jgi:hypothetical protein
MTSNNRSASTKPASKPADEKVLTEKADNQRKDELWAQIGLGATASASAVSHRFLDGLIDPKSTSWQALAGVLDETTKKVNEGDLVPLEDMLISQATALQAIFTHLTIRASCETHLKQYEAFLGLGLKAQSQSRATLQALIELKLPRQAVFAKQANIAHGHQQVNNHAGDASRTEEIQPNQNKLLADQTYGGTYLDTIPTGSASQGDKALATLEAIDRPNDKGG